jgi:hypothetical protein
VIAFLTVHNSYVDLNDSYRLIFGDTISNCEQACMYDVRCYGYYYQFSPTNSGCYLKGDPTNFTIHRYELSPSTVAIKIKAGDKPWK